MRGNNFNKSWRHKSLEVLENEKWPDEKEYPTGLVRRCHEYRKISVDQLTAEQLRTLISQQIGLKYLIPLAMEFLAKDILTEADFYPGDLLETVVNAGSNAWNQNADLRKQLLELIETNSEKIENADLDLNKLDALRNQ
jgi:hypothetical protein